MIDESHPEEEIGRGRPKTAADVVVLVATLVICGVPFAGLAINAIHPELLLSEEKAARCEENPADPACVSLFERLAPVKVGEEELGDGTVEEVWKRPKLRATLRQFVGDRFLLKEHAVDVHAELKVGWFGVSSNPQVILGRKRWCFIDDAPSTEDAIRHRARWDERQLHRLVAYHDTVRAALAAEGIGYYVAIAPDKATIHPEFLPAWLLVDEESPSLLDGFLAHCAEDAPELALIDLRDAVAAARDAEDEPVYQRTDTHWTDLGAYPAYRAIVDRVREDFPGTGLLPRDELQRLPVTRPTAGDLAVFLGVNHDPRFRDVFTRLLPPGVDPEADIDERRLQQVVVGGSGEAGQPRLVMQRDSFAQRLLPYLDRSFAHATYLWHPHVDLPHILALPEGERPDLVVSQFVERWLRRPRTLVPSAWEAP